MTTTAVHAGGKRPLLVASDLDAPLAWRDGQPISRRQFVADALRQAEVLPEAGSMINLCVDRYRFAVGFAAALLRARTSLLPPNVLPQTLASLGATGEALHLLSDVDAVAGVALPQLQVLPGHAGANVDAVPAIDAAQVAACLLTSGSTGTPQPHAKSWSTLVRNVAGASRRLAGLLQRSDLEGLAVVATVPAQHSYGFESTVLLGLLGGAAFDAGRPFFAADIAQALRSVPRPRALVTTPFHLKTLLQSSVALPAVDLVLSATAPLSPQLALQAERSFGGLLIEIYGCTEAGQVATRRTVDGELWTTFDELAIRGLPGDDGSPTQRFVVEGGHVAQPTPLADILQLETPQRFRLLGRADDLIHVAGKRSSLGHLNFQLNSIEGVVDGAFVLDDERADAVVRPVAVVVAPGLDQRQIIAALRRRLDPVFVPRRVIHVDALPREATGKLTLAALRKLAAARPGGAGR